MRDHLWSPWRFEYVTTPKTNRCPFCDAPAEPAGESLVVHHGARVYVVLNRHPYNAGHLLVVPYRHQAALSDLSLDELSELALLSQRCEAVLQEVYEPEGINLGVNLGRAAGAGYTGHLHVHLVPRWDGDTNFMTVLAETRVLPEEPRVSAERLRPVFERWTSTSPTPI
jgi:ATP adenylyltransferase